MFDTRKHFIDSWLTETPELLPPLNMDHIFNEIEERIDVGMEIIDLGDGFNQIGIETIYVWYKDTLAASFDKKYQVLLVNGVVKKHKGGPYASDLYEKVLSYNKESIRIISDRRLSDEGFKFWQRLFKKGLKISVYDTNFPGQSFTNINSIEDMKGYVGGPEKRNYQFVLSEKIGFLDTKSRFNLRRIRELAGDQN